MKARRVRALVTGAGTGSSGNVIRALRAIRPVPYIVGVNDDRFTLTQSRADRNYLCLSAATREFVDMVSGVVVQERLNVVMPTDDESVKALSDHRTRFAINLLLPRRGTIDLCQDKYALNVRLLERGVPAPRTYALRSLRDLDLIFARLGGEGPFWCRARRGSRSRGATAVTSVAQARAWISLWADLRGARVTDFTISEYLPGRHFIVQSVWREGRLLLAQAVEVLSYFAAGHNPSGVFSLSSLAKTVAAPEALRVALQAVRAADPRPSGTFFVELREAVNGVPCITEINAGRFPSGVTALFAKGKHNMVGVFARTAAGETVTVDECVDSPEDLYLVRDIDAAPGIVSARRILEQCWEKRPGRPARFLLGGRTKVRYKGGAQTAEEGRSDTIEPGGSL
jgi:carbamoyl-phosphate synthase large subunit